jgi:hemerythrin-like metal-binding protein
MEWQNTFSVGVPELDEHHHHLFDLLNKAHDTCLQGMQEDVYSNIVKELAEYATYHFNAEELFMEQHAYPNLAAHREEHIQLANKIADSSKLMSSGHGVGRIEMIELTAFLIDWLFHHILEVDMHYSKLLQAG